MLNEPGVAESLDLALAPAVLPADGASTATATVVVTDEYGNRVSGDDVEIDGGGGPTAGPLQSQADGSLSSLLTASKLAGGYTVSATDSSVTPPLSGSATLTQKALPPQPAPSAVGPPAVPPPAAPAPRVRITGGPKGEVTARRVRFSFRALGPGAVSFQCRLDGSRWARCKSPSTLSVSPGAHSFRVRAVAADGSAGAVAKRAFKRVAAASAKGRRG